MFVRRAIHLSCQIPTGTWRRTARHIATSRSLVTAGDAAPAIISTWRDTIPPTVPQSATSPHPGLRFPDGRLLGGRSRRWEAKVCYGTCMKVGHEPVSSAHTHEHPPWSLLPVMLRRGPSWTKRSGRVGTRAIGRVCRLSPSIRMTLAGSSGTSGRGKRSRRCSRASLSASSMSAVRPPGPWSTERHRYPDRGQQPGGHGRVRGTAPAGWVRLPLDRT